MLDQLRQLFHIEFYYWYKKQIGVYIYKRVYKDKEDLMLSIWEYHKIKGYDDGWYSSWWKNFIVWKNYKGKGVSN